MEEYLKVSEVIDWQHPKIMECAKQISLGCATPIAIAKVCFEWVRDEICHSFDYQMNPLTCRASDVLQIFSVNEKITWQLKSIDSRL
ncbi:hypothetical protein N0Y54_41480 [Nostoc punctiforme UO1]|uniref:hypothetical protein n=1 Tax=Nostoc punctiforme TaxID=272131 RepID=UPI0030B4E323